jgi:curved DNA-binding protein CbpA
MIQIKFEEGDGMDFYQVLRVATDASRNEIEEAYKKLVKESRYDAAINLKDVENAYKVLGNEATKKIYDSKQLLASTTTQKRKKRKKRKTLFTKLTTLSFQQLITIFVISIVVAGVFYSVRFGYMFKDFERGDRLYDNETGKVFGVILEVQPNHLFSDVKQDAYFIEVQVNHQKVWLPQHSVKLRYHKRGQEPKNTQNPF